MMTALIVVVIFIGALLLAANTVITCWMCAGRLDPEAPGALNGKELTRLIFFGAVIYLWRMTRAGTLRPQIPPLPEDRTPRTSR